MQQNQLTIENKQIFYDYPTTEKSKTEISYKIKKHISNKENFSFYNFFHPFNRKYGVEKVELDTKFIDYFFFPDKISIFGEKENNLKDIKWVRAENLTDKNKVFSSIKPDEIVQGNLGNCWLISAISSLCNKPEIFERIFPEKNLSSDGKYELNLYKNGEKTKVIIDSFIPVDKKTNKPIGGWSSRNQVWLPLVVKAYAKLHGSYLSLIGGECHEAFADLTGYPSGTIDTEHIQNTTDFWNKISKKIQNKNYVLTAGISDKIHSNKLKNIHDKGLVVSHAYSVLNVKEELDKSGNTIKLIELRNPWNKFKWKGDYSDKSSKWSSLLDKDINSNIGSGTFWMDINDFRQYFDTLSYCKVEPNIERMNQKFKLNLVNEHNKKSVINPLFEIKVPKGQTIKLLGIHQQDERYNNSKKLIDISGYVMKKGSNGSLFAESFLPSEIDRWTQKKVNLTSGNYLVIPYSSGLLMGHGDDERDLNLVLHYTSSNLDQKPSIIPCKSNHNTLVECQSKTIKKFGTKNESVEKVYSIESLKMGGMVLTSILRSKKPNLDYKFETDISKCRNIFPTLDSWQKQPIQNFNMSQKQSDLRAVIGTFTRKNNNECHFQLGVDFVEI